MQKTFMYCSKENTIILKHMLQNFLHLHEECLCPSFFIKKIILGPFKYIKL